MTKWIMIAEKTLRIEAYDIEEKASFERLLQELGYNVTEVYEDEP